MNYSDKRRRLVVGMYNVIKQKEILFSFSLSSSEDCWNLQDMDLYFHILYQKLVCMSSLHDHVSVLPCRLLYFIFI